MSAEDANRIAAAARQSSNPAIGGPPGTFTPDFSGVSVPASVRVYWARALQDILPTTFYNFDDYSTPACPNAVLQTWESGEFNDVMSDQILIEGNTRVILQDTVFAAVHNMETDTWSAVDYVEDAILESRTLTGNISSVTAGTPIVVGSAGHGLITGSVVTITDEPLVNGVWTITVVSADSFSIDGSSGGTSVGSSAGVWTATATSDGYQFAYLAEWDERGQQFLRIRPVYIIDINAFPSVAAPETANTNVG